MGRAILKFTDNHLESFKCKSKENAKKLADKRPKVIEWHFYENNERILQAKAKVLLKKIETSEERLKELEFLMRSQGLIENLKIV